MISHRGDQFWISVKGRPITEYKDRDNNVFVEGREGSNYEICYRANFSNSHFDNIKRKVIISVDGLNVLTGDTVWEKGYVVDPNQTLVIPGWRIDKAKVAAFEFSKIRDTYANSQSSNIGVIGVMVFNEIKPVKVHTPPTTTIWRGTITASGGTWNDTFASPLGFDTSNQSAASSTRRIISVNSIGTGWGEEKVFNTQVDHTMFNATPVATSAIYYDDAKGLERRGIIVKRSSIKKDPFPGYKKIDDFGCTPLRRR